MDDIAKQFLKTYQVWHHRRLLLTAINSVDVAQLELELVQDLRLRVRGCRNIVSRV